MVVSDFIFCTFFFEPFFLASLGVKSVFFAVWFVDESLGITKTVAFFLGFCFSLIFYRVFTNKSIIFVNIRSFLLRDRSLSFYSNDISSLIYSKVYCRLVLLWSDEVSRGEWHDSSSNGTLSSRRGASKAL